MLTDPSTVSGSSDDLSRLTIAGDLTDCGWSQQDHFLPHELTVALALECHALHDRGMLQAAAVGRGEVTAVRPAIRGDQIVWLQAGQSIACDRYLLIMENLRLMLNRTLFMGLNEYESHFAFYAPGASYAKHLDRFRDDDRRTVSVVIYLNAEWLPEQGGALRLHPDGKGSEDISPFGSRLVLFLSADMLHEVLPSTRNRLSLAGWFRRRA
jgi:SM-20-related protein